MKTVAATRAATEDDLVAGARPRLDAMLACGTTTAEVKSGYGLETETELRMLRAIRRLGALQPIELAATFMGAHEIPVEYRDRREEYVRLVIDEMIPAVAREGLAEWCDVFCEQRRVHAGRVAPHPRGRRSRTASSRASTPTSSR